MQTLQALIQYEMVKEGITIPVLPAIPLSTVQHAHLQSIDSAIDDIWESLVDNDLTKTSHAFAVAQVALFKFANRCGIDIETETRTYLQTSQNEQAIQTVGKEKA